MHIFIDMARVNECFISASVYFFFIYQQVKVSVTPTKLKLTEKYSLFREYLMDKAYGSVLWCSRYDEVSLIFLN